MKKLLSIMIALFVFLPIACDDGKSTPTGSVKITVTRDSTDGYVLAGLYKSIAGMTTPGTLPDYTATTFPELNATTSPVEIIINNVAVGDYYVTGTLDSNAYGTSGFGNPCSTIYDIYFIHEGKTYATIATANAVTINENQETLVSITINDAHIFDAPTCTAMGF